MAITEAVSAAFGAKPEAVISLFIGAASSVSSRINSPCTSIHTHIWRSDDETGVIPVIWRKECFAARTAAVAVGNYVDVSGQLAPYRCRFILGFGYHSPALCNASAHALDSHLPLPTSHSSLRFDYSPLFFFLTVHQSPNQRGPYGHSVPGSATRLLVPSLSLSVSLE